MATRARTTARTIEEADGGIRVEFDEQKSAPTTEERNKVAILAALDALGGDLTAEDAVIFEGTKLVAPASFNGDIDGVIRFLRDHKEQAETEHQFDKTFRYRYNDGAMATQNVLRKLWGSTGIGGSIQTMFGRIPPSFVTIDVGFGKTAQVPQNRVNFAPLDASLYFAVTHDPELGPLFRLVIEAPRKHRGRIEGLFAAIENELRVSSIYKGQAITGATTPGFIDLSTVDPSKVVYSDEVMTQLDANIWSVLKHADVLRELNIDLKRAVLLEGPFGTGKTLAAFLTAQVAVANGWTFLFCRPGMDDLAETMRTALLYAPSVVFFEDVDVVAETGDPDAVSKLLDLFDGIGAKNQPCVAVLTTNHADKIHKAMLRPGRLDAVIHIGALDQQGITKLIFAKVPKHLLADDLDFVAISEAMEGYLPSFAAEAIDRTMRYAISRAGGTPSALTTVDFVEAAHGLRSQLDLMQKATEGVRRPTIEAAFKELVIDASHGIRVLDHDEDEMYTLARPEEQPA